jgi:hypothetical protein
MAYLIDNCSGHEPGCPLVARLHLFSLGGNTKILSLGRLLNQIQCTEHQQKPVHLTLANNLKVKQMILWMFVNSVQMLLIVLVNYQEK